MSQEHAVLDIVREVLGSKALGTYVHGSAVVEGLRPASDLDILVVASTSLTARERRALAEAIGAISGPRHGARSVELTVVVADAIRPWRYPPTADFLYGDWLRDEIILNGAPRAQPMTNLAVEIPILLSHGRIIDGAPPRDLFDPVPPEDIVRACHDALPGLLGDLRGDERNVVLTLARIWATVSTGEILSKSRAAAWALARIPAEQRPVLAHARHLYLTSTYADETWPEGLLDQVEAHVRFLVDRITEAAPAAQL